MNMELFSIYDLKTQIYQPPLFAHNSGHALRMVSDHLRNPETSIARYPADFLLYHIGSFDDQNGLITPLETGPQQIITISHLVQMDKE